jgi:protein involved in polysaccharide export with SLBB domain
MPTQGRTTSLAVLLSVIALSLAGCATPLLNQSELPPVAPPEETVHIKQSTEKIKPGEMLQFRLPEDPSAPVNGLYQVAADGTIALRDVGRLQVGDKTLEEARQMLPSVLSLNYAMQSMELTPYEFYLVRAKDEEVKRVIRVPLKDGDTVKDALRGAPPLAGMRIWISRRSHANPGREILVIDWRAITHGDNATNYKLRCGDYLMVADKPPSALQKLLDPGLSPSSSER